MIKKILLYSSLSALLLSTVTQAVDTLFYASNDILFYSPGESCVNLVSDTGTATGRVGSYTNPVINTTAPDPSVIFGDDGKFHLYATGFQHFVSKDMVNWKKVDKDGWINIKNGPGWLAERWAPDIAKIDDIYILSVSGRSSGDRKIGYATSDSAAGPFEYQGELLHPSDRGAYGMGYDIDPNILQTDEGVFLYYGSGSGSISVAKLTKNGKKLSAEKSKKVLNTSQGVGPVLAEGPYVHKKGDYYYMYFSSGNWQDKSGGASAYRQYVARSKSPTGNFEEKKGAIIASNAAFKSPGHGSVITDGSGNDWKVYMAYPKGTENRAVVIDKINYINDWPVINNGKGPSSIKQFGTSSSSSTTPSSTETDTIGSSCVCKTPMTALSGSDNGAKVFNFFLNKGYSAEQAAGIVGNIKAESGILPMRKQNTGQEVLTSSKEAEGISSGWGIVQWTPAGKMIKPSKEAGKSYSEIDTLEYQVNFLWEQLEGEGIGGSSISEKRAGDDLKKQTTIDGAARSFMLKYERPKDQSESHQKSRSNLAMEMFGLYGQGTPSGTVSVSDTGSTTTADNSSCGGQASSTSSGDVVSIAQQELAKGVKENPVGCDSANSSSKGSCGPEVDKYTDNHLEYWCADFVSWVYKQAGKPFSGGSSGGWRIPAVASIREWFKENGTWIENGAGVTPEPGDVYTMGISHTGIVEKVEGNKIYTISGNTSTDNTGNGNGVGRGSYSIGSADIEGFGRMK